MAILPERPDPTLEAVDRALEEREAARQRRGYLGMSGLGLPCDRELWYGFRWVCRFSFGAVALKRFEDGHRGEDVQAERLRMVQGITLLTVNPDTGRQWGFEDHGGHIAGNMDGALLGLLQAPATWHVWEHKQVNEDKQAKLHKLKQDRGEKNALAAWDEVYYVQAVLYMHFAGLERHYLTASSPGGRTTISCRTEADPATALRMIARAKRIVDSPRPPQRISNDPAWWQCRQCSFRAVCHEKAFADRNCRTCLHSTPLTTGEGGRWWCEKHGHELDREAQETGCSLHLLLPDLVPGEQIDAGETWVSYRLGDGTVWVDGHA